jgi:hypothetical protein
MTKTPSWKKEFGVSLRKMLLTYDQRIKKIYFYGWHIQRKQSRLACKAAVVLSEDKTIRFFILFGKVGDNQVSLLTED